MRYLRFFLACCALAAITLNPQGCAPKTVVTPQGQAAYTADQVVKVVAALQNAAIQANQQKLLTDADAVKVVQTCVDLEKTLKAVPTGWQGTVRAAWTALKASISVGASQTLAATFTAVDVAVASLGGI